ncbi:bifunctional glutamate N-acetyltransferase/amino-acid acetyltransferase ArgJ [Nitratifractor sp.]
MFTLYSLKDGLANVEGFYYDGVNCGLRPDPSQGDLAFIRSNRPCRITTMFTTNRFQAAPLRHASRYGKSFEGNFLLANAKNANAMTGEAGIRDIETVLGALPKELGAQNPVMSSTGVIGYRLPVDKIVKGLDKLDWNARNSDAAARAIMTTDSFKKELCFEVELENGERFRVAAIAKGAGMINPAMATMLCFIATDAAVPAEEMEELLEEAVSLSFNRISVDGDTSTNDSVFLMANGASGAYEREAFAEALKKITFELAMLILKDGEGANKVVAFEVTGAASDEEAAVAAVALSNSLLVKTALFGEDPNWGRIASTIGASGVECEEEKLVIHYDDLLVYDAEHRELDPEREEKAYAVMKKDSFKIRCDLGMGEGSFTAYGCDLSYDYVKINAEYRT